MIDVETKRDFLYTAICVLVTPATYILFGDVISRIIEDEEIPLSIVSYIWFLEFSKVLIVSLFYTTPYILDSSHGGFSVFSGSSGNKNYRLPFSKRESNYGSGSGSAGLSQNIPWMYRLITVVTDILKGTINFAGGVAVCHILLVLFGAPFLEKWKITLQFSFALVCWLYFPLTFVIQPSSILQELLYISSWKHENSSLYFAKWRFLLVTFGAWIGAIVVPLDWDRPWQKWPIPCLVSSFISNVLVNFLLCVYFSYKTLLRKKSSDQITKSFKSPAKGIKIK